MTEENLYTIEEYHAFITQEELGNDFVYLCVIPEKDLAVQADSALMVIEAMKKHIISYILLNGNDYLKDSKLENKNYKTPKPLYFLSAELIKINEKQIIVNFNIHIEAL